MEIHSATTRFALACNASAKVIEPIQSRCAIVRFSKLKSEDVLKQVKWVAAQVRWPLPPTSVPASDAAPWARLQSVSRGILPCRLS